MAAAAWAFRTDGGPPLLLLTVHCSYGLERKVLLAVPVCLFGKPKRRQLCQPPSPNQTLDLTAVNLTKLVDGAGSRVPVTRCQSTVLRITAWSSAGCGTLSHAGFQIADRTNMKGSITLSFNKPQGCTGDGLLPPGPRVRAPQGAPALQVPTLRCTCSGTSFACAGCCTGAVSNLRYCPVL